MKRLRALAEGRLPASGFTSRASPAQVSYRMVSSFWCNLSPSSTPYRSKQWDATWALVQKLQLTSLCPAYGAETLPEHLSQLGVLGNTSLPEYGFTTTALRILSQNWGSILAHVDFLLSLRLPHEHCCLNIFLYWCSSSILLLLVLSLQAKENSGLGASSFFSSFLQIPAAALFLTQSFPSFFLPLPSHTYVLWYVSVQKFSFASAVCLMQHTRE